MKNLCLLIIALIHLYSCKKCGKCQFTTTTTSYPSIAGYPQIVNSEEEACGDSYKEMEDFKTTTSSVTSGGYTISTTVKKTGCQQR